MHVVSIGTVTTASLHPSSLRRLTANSPTWGHHSELPLTPRPTPHGYPLLFQTETPNHTSPSPSGGDIHLRGDNGGAWAEPPEHLRLPPTSSDPTIPPGWLETPESRRGDPGHGEVTAGGNWHDPERNGAISLRHRREGRDKEPHEYLNCNLPRFLQLTFFFFFFFAAPRQPDIQDGLRP